MGNSPEFISSLGLIGLAMICTILAAMAMSQFLADEKPNRKNPYLKSRHDLDRKMASQRFERHEGVERGDP